LSLSWWHTRALKASLTPYPPAGTSMMIPPASPVCGLSLSLTLTMNQTQPSQKKRTYFVLLLGNGMPSAPPAPNPLGVPCSSALGAPPPVTHAASPPPNAASLKRHGHAHSAHQPSPSVTPHAGTPYPPTRTTTAPTSGSSLTTSSSPFVSMVMTVT
jgi:hypothetical protein